MAKNDAVMKEDEDSREELDLYQKEIDQISSIHTAILKEEYLNLIAAATDLYDNDLAITDLEAILKEGHEKSTVVSEEESVDSYVADFETPLSHQDDEHHSAMNDNTDNVISIIIHSRVMFIVLVGKWCFEISNIRIDGFFFGNNS